MTRYRRFITFEGGEGAGKSTQIGRLAERISAAGGHVVVTHEPGGPPYAETLRRVLLSGVLAGRGPTTEAFLFAASRAEHVATVIKPAVDRGLFVLCDRYIDSTRVYQGVAGARFYVLRALEDYAIGTLIPDLTILLDLPVELGLARIGSRDGMAPDRFEADAKEIHERRRAAFLALAAKEPERFAVIDAAGNEAAVALDVTQAVARRLGVPIEPQGAAAAGRRTDGA